MILCNFATMNPVKTYHIIVAAGKGSRFGADLPKQFCLLDNKPVLMHTIERMRKSLPESEIVLVLNVDHLSLWEELCHRYDFMSPRVVTGGSTRWESVKNAVDTIVLDPMLKSVITVHDGARPLINRPMIERIMTAACNASGAIPTVAVSDSLRMLDDDGVNSHPVDRQRLRAVQTPQAFDATKLKQAYTLPYEPGFTDDASVMAAAGYTDITLVEGDPHNIKITLPDDLAIASLYLQNEPIKES